MDIDGHEKVRVNYSSRTGVVTLPSELQDKSNYGYFHYAQTLDAEEIGGWGIELESEYGELTYPYTPVLRVITPVQTPERRVGYLVINLDVNGD